MAGPRRDFPPTRRGYDPREVVSALQKAIRRSEPDEALYWAYELDKSGYGAWLWKRLRVITSEDIGPAAPGLVADVHALNEQWEKAHKKSSDGHELLFITHAVIAMALAPKCRVTDWALFHHRSDHVERLEIPDVALDKHTLRGKQMGRGFEHFLHESSALVQLGERDREAVLDPPLAILEDYYRLEVEKAVEAPDQLPSNPWEPYNDAQRPIPALKPTECDSCKGSGFLNEETGRPAKEGQEGATECVQCEGTGMFPPSAARPRG